MKKLATITAAALITAGMATSASAQLAGQVTGGVKAGVGATVDPSSTLDPVERTTTRVQGTADQAAERAKTRVDTATERASDALDATAERATEQADATLDNEANAAAGGDAVIVAGTPAAPRTEEDAPNELSETARKLMPPLATNLLLSTYHRLQRPQLRSRLSQEIGLCTPHLLPLLRWRRRPILRT